MWDEALQLFQRGAIKSNSCNEHHLLYISYNYEDTIYMERNQIWIISLSTEKPHVVAST